MSNNNKIKFPLWVKPKTMETVKQMYKDDNCRSQSEFRASNQTQYTIYLFPYACQTFGVLHSASVSDFFVV